jgi:hypothetical protein
MKTNVPPHVVASLVLVLSLPLSAQNLASNLLTSDSSAASSFDGGMSGLPFVTPAVFGQQVLPEPGKVRGEIDVAMPFITSQNTRDLGMRLRSNLPPQGPSADPGILKRSALIRRLAVSSNGSLAEGHEETLAQGLKELSATYREAGKSSDQADCSAIALSVAQRVKSEPEKVLEWVELEISANPACACEIVKAAINASEADVQGVVAIVETAVLASPESMRLISQCAIAALPESLGEVQSLLARIDPNAGKPGDSSKSSKGSPSVKGAKVAAIVAPPLPNPLDLPPAPPPFPPPPIYPDPVTKVDPSCLR